MASAGTSGTLPRGRSVLYAVAVLLGTQIVSVLWAAVMLVVFWGGTAPDPLTPTALVLLGGGLWIGYGLGSALVAQNYGAGPAAEFGTSLRRLDLPIGVALGVVTQVALLPLLYIVVGRFVSDDPGESARELIESADGPLDVALLLLAVVVMAPLVEELFFRGLLLRSLDSWVGSVPAVVISSALFAMVHGQLILLPGLFLFAVIAAVVTLRTGRLGIAWMMHAAFNLATVALVSFGYG